MGGPIFQRTDAGIDHRLGCVKIRFANPQRDDFFHRGGDIKKATNARGFQ